MQLETRKYLFDIQRAIALLGEFTEGKTFEDYSRDAMRRAAVEREFEIIGEALTQLMKLDAAVAAGHGWRIGRIVDPFGHHWEVARQEGGSSA